MNHRDLWYFFLTADDKKVCGFFVCGTILVVLSDRKVYDYETAIEIQAIDFIPAEGSERAGLVKDENGRVDSNLPYIIDYTQSGIMRGFSEYFIPYRVYY